MDEPLDSRQLTAFVTLAKTGSYTETARQLFVTHSAISHAMRALETNAGCRLLSRMGKKVILTEAGEALLQHAEHVLAEMRQARLTLEGLNKWGFYRLRLAAEVALGPHFLTAAIIKFHQQFPRVLVSVELESGCEARTLLETNRVDFVIAEQSLLDERFEFIPLFEDVYLFVVNQFHPWAAHDSVPRDELRKQPCVEYQASAQTRRKLQEYFGKDGIVLNTVVEIDSIEATKEFVRQTPCLSLLPAWSIRKELQAGTLVGLPLGRNPPKQTWGFMHWRGRSLNHGEATFLQYCREGVAAASNHGPTNGAPLIPGPAIPAAAPALTPPKRLTETPGLQSARA